MDWKKHSEIILILFGFLTGLMLFGNIEFSERLIVVSTMSLGLYYLMSGALVLFNRHVLRLIRIIYFIGLWSITVGYLGIAFRLRFWPNSGMLLLMAIGFGVVVMSVLILYRFDSKEKKPELRKQLSPLFKRLLFYPALFLLFYMIPNLQLYQSIGPERHDPEYTGLFIELLENPTDSLKQKALLDYMEIKNRMDDN